MHGFNKNLQNLGKACDTCIYIISKIPISIEIAQNEYKMKD